MWPSGPARPPHDGAAFPPRPQWVSFVETTLAEPACVLTFTRDSHTKSVAFAGDPGPAWAAKGLSGPTHPGPRLPACVCSHAPLNKCPFHRPLTAAFFSCWWFLLVTLCLQCPLPPCHPGLLNARRLGVPYGEESVRSVGFVQGLSRIAVGCEFRDVFKIN